MISDPNCTRSNFVNSWLMETPEFLGQFPIGNEVIRDIQYRLYNNISTAIDLSDLYLGLKKIETDQSVYYWIQDTSGTILLACAATKRPQCIAIGAVSKTGTRGQPPYASDLYELILQDQRSHNSSIRFMSDTMLSDDGFKIWRRLFDRGYKISVYDNTNPGQSFKVITSIEELEQYLGDRHYKKYQFVLSEAQYSFQELLSFFSLRRIRELGGAL